MKPKSPHRYRVCGTPVRTGCITCKIRRVKCGEEKPCCKRCTSTGRKCDGYAPIAKPAPCAQRPSPTNTPFNPVGDPIEQRLLSSFTTFTAPKLSGNFASDFWERRVIQASLVEPSIRHGIIAIGAIHQGFISRYEHGGKNGDTSIEAFAFQQDTKAISHLHRLMSTRTQQLDITLITCILFICFDSLLGNHASAIIHLKAGLTILEDIKRQNVHGATFSQITTAHEWEREFAPLLLCLGVQVAAFVSPKNRNDRNALWEALKRAGVRTYSSTFNSLDEARHALDTVAAEVMADRTSTSNHMVNEQVPNPKGPEGQWHISALQNWEDALNRSLPGIVRRDTSTNKAQRGASMLKVHSLMISIVIGIPELADDKFEKILAFCKHLIGTRTGCSCCHSHPNFSTDMGVINPLFFVALRAPQNSVQRRAYEMLLRAPGREGMWETEAALRAAGEAVGVQNLVHEPVGGGLVLPRPCPQLEARTWNEIAVKLETRIAQPFGQMQEVTIPPAFIHEFPLTYSAPDGPGLPFTVAEYLATDQPDM